MELSNKQKRELKARAHSLKAVVQTGSQGLTDAVTAEVDTQLAHHELMKVRFAGADKASRQAMAEAIAARLDAAVVGSIGNVVILYREAPEG